MDEGNLPIAQDSPAIDDNRQTPLTFEKIRLTPEQLLYHSATHGVPQVRYEIGRTLEYFGS